MLGIDGKGFGGAWGSFHVSKCIYMANSNPKVAWIALYLITRLPPHSYPSEDPAK